MKDSRLEIVKYINDPVYGGIPITQMELDIIDTPIFQRLRGLRQLGRVNFVFPGAEHSRYVHSLGVLYIMGLMTDHLYSRELIDENDVVIMRVAALLHDIGHYPLSHLGESVYGYIKENELASGIIIGDKSAQKKPMYEIASSYSKKAHHEHLGKYIIANNNDIKTILERNGIDPVQIGEIITGEYGDRNMVYTGLLHSSLDADRLDYLLRDSYQTGVKYGLVDLQYLVRLLCVVEDSSIKTDCNKVLAFNKKGQHVVEHFLMARYFHYSQVIHHKTNASFEGMIKCMYVKLIQAGKFMYANLEEIHSAINDEGFLDFNDSALDTALRDYYYTTNDEEYKRLHEMYRDRIRPKVIYEIKDLYADRESDKRLIIAKRELKRHPDEFSKIIGSDRWGYQNVQINLEKVHCYYKLLEENASEEELREAVKMYDPDKNKISLLAADSLSIISKLANYTSEFLRIYVLEERGKEQDYEGMRRKINALLSEC